jgi:heme exporter protein A
MTFDTVDARGLTKVYGRQRALAGVDLTLRAGEATALLGPNGAGKSTLVGILSTLVAPTAGQVRYGSAEPSAETTRDDDELRAAIGLIAHESLCYGDLTGRENLIFFARLYGVADAGRAADALLGRVGLTDAAGRAARTYSRGMMQRLAVARAIVHKPRLLLADEPFTGLDRDGVALLSEILREERARGCILVIVTHDFEAVSPLIDHVVVLTRGRVVEDRARRSDERLADIYREAVSS